MCFLSAQNKTIVHVLYIVVKNCKIIHVHPYVHVYTLEYVILFYRGNLTFIFLLSTAFSSSVLSPSNLFSLWSSCCS